MNSFKVRDIGFRNPRNDNGRVIMRNEERKRETLGSPAQHLVAA
jgi:hypothetical protein